MNKEQVKKVMIDHLKTKGYPNMTSKEILAELKPMWEKLVALNLVPGYTAGQFVQVAHAEEHLSNLKAALKDELAHHFTGFTKR